MDFPNHIATGLIEGRFLAAALDNLDPGDRPQAEAVESLRVEITPTVAHVKVPGMLLWVPVYELATNRAGELVNPKTGASTIRLLSTDYGFRYLIKVTAKGMPTLMAQVTVAAGETVDLADVVDFPVPDLETTEQWEAVVSLVTAMRDEVVTAATAITAALDGQDLAVVASWASDTHDYWQQTAQLKTDVEQLLDDVNIPALQALKGDAVAAAGDAAAAAASAAGSASDAAGYAGQAEGHATAAQSSAADAAASAALASQIVGEGVIADDVTGAATTWSSAKIDAEKAAVVHSHEVADITGLNAVLAGKADSAHTHAASDLTSGTLSYLRLPVATTSNRGALTRASNQVAATGTSTSSAVTPAALKHVLGAVVPRVWTTTVLLVQEGNAGGRAVVTFPAGFFTETPVVQVTKIGLNPNPRASMSWTPDGTVGGTVDLYTSVVGTAFTPGTEVMVTAIQVP